MTSRSLIIQFIQQNNIYEAQMLIKQDKQDLNLRNDMFIESCKHDNLDMLKMLLKEGADINYMGSTTSILCAIQNNNITMLTFLLENNADPNIFKSTTLSPLQHAVLSNLHNMTRLLLEYNADIEYTSKLHFSNLFIAIKNHDTVMIDILLEFNVNLNDICKIFYRNHTALTYSCSLGYIDIVRRLIEHKVDLNIIIGDKCALFIAVRQDNQIILQELIDNNVNVNITNLHNQNALFLTTNVKNIELLIKNKINLNCQDNDGNTPCMHHLSSANKIERMYDLIKTIINAGVDLTLINKMKQTVFMLLIFNNLDNLLQEVLKNTKNINYFSQDFQNKTMYDYAIDNALLFHNVNCLHILKENKLFKCNDVIYATCIQDSVYFLNKDKNININFQDCLNNTALHYALRSKNDFITKKLLEDPRLNIYATNNKNESIMQCETTFVYKRIRLEITYNYNISSCKLLSKYLIRDIIDNIIYKYITDKDIDEIFNKKF